MPKDLEDILLSLDKVSFYSFLFWCEKEHQKRFPFFKGYKELDEIRAFLGGN